MSLALPGRLFTTESPREAPRYCLLLLWRLVVYLATPWTIEPARLHCLWDFLGKNIRVGCHFLLQRIFPDPGIEPQVSGIVGRYFIAESPGNPVVEASKFKFVR